MEVGYLVRVCIQATGGAVPVSFHSHQVAHLVILRTVAQPSLMICLLLSHQEGISTEQRRIGNVLMVA